MKRYSVIVILHVVGISLFAIGSFWSFISVMPFTGVLLLICLTSCGCNLYRMQMIQIRLMRQLSQNIRCGDTALSFRSKYRNGPLEEMTEELREAMRLYRIRTMEANEVESWQKLIRVMGHEIMNSITPIISLSETLGNRTVDKNSYSYMQHGMQVIHRRSKGLLEFVENYRKITRIPAPVKAIVSLNALLGGIAELFPQNYIRFAVPSMDESKRFIPSSGSPTGTAHSAAGVTGAHSSTDVQKESISSTDILLRIDRNQIEQVLINLVKNAVEACSQVENPEIRIEASVTDVVTISVSDNGPGILPQVMEQIFIPFFTTKDGGSGIGLSLCRRIMQLHGGSITATSTPGQGSCFSISVQMHRI